MNTTPKNRFNWKKNTGLFHLNTILPLLTCLMLCMSLFAAPSSFAQNTNPKELPTLLKALQDTNPYIVIETARALGAYPYRESEAALIYLIGVQISRGPDGLNPQIMGAAMESLAIIGTQPATEKLNALILKLLVLPVTASFDQRTKDQMDIGLRQVVKLMSERAEPLRTGLQLKLAQKPKLKVVDGIRTVEIDGVAHEFMADLVAHMGNMGERSAAIVSAATIEYLTDSVLQEIADGGQTKIVGRDQEAKDALLTLVRMKGQNPVFIGSAGVGKTTIAQRLAQMLTTELPANALYNDLREAVIIETSPARIARLSQMGPAAGVEAFFNAVLEVERGLGRPIIVFIDEIHTLSEPMIEAMKPYLDSKTKSIKLVGASTGREFNMAFKHNEAMRRRMQLIEVKEFSLEQTIDIVRQTWEVQVSKRYGVRFSPDAIKSIVTNAQTLLPDNGRFDGAIKIMQDIAIAESDARPNETNLQIGEAQVNTFLQRRLGYPINPKDGRAMQAYRKELTQQLEGDVLFQKGMIDSTIDLWMELMGNSDRGVRVQALLGPTGTGKSELGRSLAKRVFSREGAFLEIDANTYKSRESLNALLGAPPGFISSDKTSGVLIDYLDDPSKGKFGGVILINEAERMPPEAWERLMEMLDVGEIAGGDGRTRKLKRHLIILTSNRVDKIVFPAGIERLTDGEMDKHIAKYDNDKLRETYRQKSSGTDQFLLPDPIIARVDRWSLAKPITLAMGKTLALRMSEKAAVKMGERYGVKVEITPEASELMAVRSFQYGMGARPVIKATQGWLEKIVTDAVAQAGQSQNQTFKISVKNGALKATVAGKSVTTLALPKGEAPDPLDDPDFAKKMKNLLPTLREGVIGQEEATKSFSQAIIAHLSDPSSQKRPTALFLVGSTGTGKTQLARSLAQALYNNADRAEVIDLSKVSFEGGLNDVFGSKKGFVGSQDRAQFEEILLRNPEGGVIVFDEASNMGGEDKTRKEALFKQGFYSLLEEGKWLSSSTGTTYDLSKYIFLFTGNDGEKLFQADTADDLRMATYKHNKDRAKVQKLLLDAGVPEAFLGRMMDVVLMKPLLSSEVKQITEGMLKSTLKSYKDRGINFDVDPEFTKEVSRAFFSPGQGARSIRSMLDSSFKATLANLIFSAGGPTALKGQSIRITLQDNLPKKAYKQKNHPERKVELVLEIRDGSGKVVQTVAEDLSTRAVKINKQSFRDARATAIHEAGHAIVNDPKVTGQRLAHLTIEGAGEYLGYARYDESPTRSEAFTRETLVAKVAKLLGGTVAQQIDGQPIDAGRGSDIKQARELISKSIMEYGLEPKLLNVFLREGKPQLTLEQGKIATEAIDQIFQEGEARARRILTAQWPLVRDVTAKLLKQGHMSGDEFEVMAARGTRVRCEQIFTWSAKK